MRRKRSRGQKTGVDLELIRKNDELRGWIPALIASVLGKAFSGSAQWSDTHKSKLYLWVTRDGSYCLLDEGKINALVNHLLRQEPLTGEIQLYRPSGSEKDRWQSIFSRANRSSAENQPRDRTPRSKDDIPWYLKEGG